MASGRGAARQGDRQLCPEHGYGKLAHGHDSVRINRRPAVSIDDMALCTGNPALSKVETGAPQVFVCGKPMAREWDTTSHGARIRRGSYNVRVGPVMKGEEMVAAALFLLENSEFGKTERGQKIVERLRGLRGYQIVIDYAPKKTGLSTDIDGYYDGHEDTVYINPRFMTDVEGAAEVLAHEGSHASRDPSGRKALEDTFHTPSDLTEEEFLAWEDERNFHEDEHIYLDDPTTIDKYRTKKSVAEKKKYIESLKK